VKLEILQFLHKMQSTMLLSKEIHDYVDYKSRENILQIA